MRGNMQKDCSVCLKGENAILEDVDLKLNRCKSCKHVFKTVEKTDEEKYKDEYFSDEHKNWFSNPDYKLFNFISHEISKMKKKTPLKVLDIGCGKGDLLKYLKKNDDTLELYGLDLSHNTSEGVHFIQGDILKDEIEGKFDVVCNIAVLEHVNSPHLFIEKISKLLNPGGMLVIVTDNDCATMYRVARMLRKLGFSTAYDRMYMLHHLQCFSHRSLRMLLENHGFEIIEHTNHNHPVAAIDYPKTNAFYMLINVLAMHILFAVSTLFSSGILQIAVSRKKG